MQYKMNLLQLILALLSCALDAQGAVLDTQDLVPIRRGPLTVDFDEIDAATGLTLPTGRKYTATTAAGDLIYLHGGTLQNNSFTDELWSFNITSGFWTNIQATNELKPPALAHHCMAATGDGFLYLFGGILKSDDYAPNSLWRFDISTRTWEIVNSSNAAQNSAAGTQEGPGKRKAASCAFANNQFYVFGGQAKDYYGRVIFLDDLWSSSVDLWTLKSGSLSFTGTFSLFNQTDCDAFISSNGNVSTKPMARHFSSMVADSTGNLWIYGGSISCYKPSLVFQVFADMWKYTTASNTWQFISGTLPMTVYKAFPNLLANYGVRGEEATNNQPGARAEHKMSVDLSTNNIYIFGGSIERSIIPNLGLDNVWKYSSSTGNFTWLFGNPTSDNVTTNPQIYTVITAKTINSPNTMNIPGSFRSGVAHYHSPSKSLIYGFGTSQIKTSTSSYLSNQLFQLKWACKPGFLWTGSACIACAVDTYPTAIFLVEGPATTCLACPTNSSTNGLVAQTICNVCDLGYEFSGIAAAPCQACTLGSFRNSSMSNCRPCSAGFFSPAPGASVCTPCASNMYSTQKSSICDVCPVGAYSNASSSCVYCNGGFGWKNSSTVTVASRCDACAAGSWSRGGQTQCQSCGAGLYSSELGSDTCQSCSLGSISTANSTTCQPCPYNWYSGDSRTVCSSCPINAITLTSGTIKGGDCVCPAGWEGDAFSCSLCAKGYYRNIGQNLYCSPCPESFSTLEIGSRSLDDCVAIHESTDPKTTDLINLHRSGISPTPTLVSDVNQTREDLSNMFPYIIGGSVGIMGMGVFGAFLIYFKFRKREMEACNIGSPYFSPAGLPLTSLAPTISRTAMMQTPTFFSPRTLNVPQPNLLYSLGNPKNSYSSNQIESSTSQQFLMGDSRLATPFKRTDSSPNLASIGRLSGTPNMSGGPIKMRSMQPNSMVAQTTQRLPFMSITTMGFTVDADTNNVQNTRATTFAGREAQTEQG